MNFFNKTPGSNQELPPLSVARVKQILEENSTIYRVDEDGDVSGRWEDGVFYFLVKGEFQEIFHILGTWYGVLGIEDAQRARDLCHLWNSEKYWPKTYAITLDDGTVHLRTEHTVDYEPGITDAQLRQHILNAVSTGSFFFEKVAEEFPEAAAKYRNKN